jgi:hypothetical protein
LWSYACVLIAIVAMGYDFADLGQVTTGSRFFLQVVPLILALIGLVLGDRSEDPDSDPYPGLDEDT